MEWAEEALEMVLALDGAGSIVYANAAAREKLEYGELLVGRHISEIFPNTFRPFNGASQTEEGLEAEYPFDKEIRQLMAYRKNRTCFPVDARMIRQDKNEVSYLCMANDILEREHLSREVEQVREEARQAAKAKSEFVANVTHELRTPVNGILGNVRELPQEDLPEPVRQSLRLVERCCGDMNKIINNILDFSKLEAGKFTLEPRRFHFRNMRDYGKANHRRKITEKGIGFFMSVSPRIPEHIIGDELRIVQILNNLLSNALKFTAVGKVTVEILKTAQVGDRIELYFIVSDTGIGIDAADKDKLFESFSQVDASISRRYGGTGLGLNICKQLVELMGGRIEVESRKNQGSTFSFSIWVELPKEEQNQESQAAGGQEDLRQSAFASDQNEDVKTYGTAENRSQLDRILSKLILCVEMENWEKAEMFMETVRQLTEGAPSEVKRWALRLKMAIQKADYEKITDAFERLNQSVGGESDA